MDLMQAFNNKYLKAEPPVATPSVFTSISRKETASVSRSSKAPSSPRSTAASRRPSPCAASPMASVWKRCSPSMLPPLRRSRPSARVRSAARSSITCATAWARALKSRSASESWILGCGEATASPQPFYKYFFCNTEAHISIPRSIICEK